jgi:hypothetical protein
VPCSVSCGLFFSRIGVNLLPLKSDLLGVISSEELTPEGFIGSVFSGVDSSNDFNRPPMLFSIQSEIYNPNISSPLVQPCRERVLTNRNIFEYNPDHEDQSQN